MISIIKLVLTLVITFFKGSPSKRSRPSNIAGMPHAKLLKYIEQSRVLLKYNYESDIILVVYIYIYIYIYIYRLLDFISYVFSTSCPS